MKRTFYIETKPDTIDHALFEVGVQLDLWNIRKHDKEQASILLREMLTKLIEVSTEEKLKIEVHLLLGDCIIRVSGRGTPLKEEDIPIGIKMPDLSEDVDSEEESIIRNFIIRSYGKKVSVHYKKGLNVATILVETSKQRSLKRTLLALFGGIILGLVLKHIHPHLSVMLADNVFEPIYTMFLNAIKMLAAPLVFFSISAAFASNGDVRRMGKLSLRVMSLFVMTSVAAILVAFAGYMLFPIGDPSLAGMVSESASNITNTAANTSISIKNTIINIVPKDFLSPFVNSDMLQVLFLSVITGMGVTKLGASAGAVNHGLDLLNDLFLKITKVVIKVMPLSICCAMANMVIKTDISSLLTVAQWMLANVGCYVLMMVIYAIIFPLFTHMSPIKFYKKFVPVMLNAFVMCSGNAVMPFNMEICRTKLGISPKAYSFAIPFGTVINKNGGCIVLTITTLFMATIFGVPIEPGMLLSLAFMIYVLSVAAPAIPGSLLICIAILLPMLGIPSNAISIIIGIYAIDAMVQTVVNVTGTVICTMIAAKSENMVDMKVWEEA